MIVKNSGYHKIHTVNTIYFFTDREPGKIISIEQVGEKVQRRRSILLKNKIKGMYIVEGFVVLLSCNRLMETKCLFLKEKKSPTKRTTQTSRKVNNPTNLKLQLPKSPLILEYIHEITTAESPFGGYQYLMRHLHQPAQRARLPQWLNCNQQVCKRLQPTTSSTLFALGFVMNNH